MDHVPGFTCEAALSARVAGQSSAEQMTLSSSTQSLPAALDHLLQDPAPLPPNTLPQSPATSSPRHPLPRPSARSQPNRAAPPPSRAHKDNGQASQGRQVPASCQQPQRQTPEALHERLRAQRDGPLRAQQSHHQRPCNREARRDGSDPFPPSSSPPLTVPSLPPRRNPTTRRSSRTSTRGPYGPSSCWAASSGPCSPATSTS